MVRLEKGIEYTQAKGCYCVHIGTWAFMFGDKQGWRIELFTPLHLFRFSPSISKKMKLRIRIGNLIREIGNKICGAYWVCSSCGNIEYFEREVMCWNCGKGKMIYQGDL